MIAYSIFFYSIIVENKMSLSDLIKTNVEKLSGYKRVSKILQYYKPETTASYNIKQVEITLPRGAVYDIKSLNLVMGIEATAGCIIPANLDIAIIKQVRVFLGSRMLCDIPNYNQIHMILRNHTWASCKRKTNHLNTLSDGAQVFPTASIPFSIIARDLIPFSMFKHELLDLKLLNEDLRVEIYFDDGQILGNFNRATDFLRFTNIWARVDEVQWEDKIYDDMVQRIIASGASIDYQFAWPQSMLQRVEGGTGEVELFLKAGSVDMLIGTALEAEYNTVNPTANTIYSQDLTQYFNKIGIWMENVEFLVNNKSLHPQPLLWSELPSYNIRQLGDKAGNVMMTYSDWYDKWCAIVKTNVKDGTLSGLDMSQGGTVRFRVNRAAGALGADYPMFLFVVAFKTSVLRYRSGITEMIE